MLRRDFLQLSSLTPLAGLLPLRFPLPDRVYETKSSWKEIAYAYPIHFSHPVNLNSGSAGNAPQVVEEAFLSAFRQMNRQAAYEKKADWQKVNKSILQQMGAELKVDPSQLSFCLNTTEGLNLIFNNAPLHKGECIYFSPHDYPFAINALKKRASTDGLPLKPLRYDPWCSDDELVSLYKAHCQSPGLLLLTQVQHRTGRIMPIEEIVQGMSNRGIQVVLDAAHAFAHVPHTIMQDITYYATSLHKWLSAPAGAGLLYIRSADAKIATRSSAPIDMPGIRQMEYTGTQHFYRIPAIAAAWQWEQTIGGTRRKYKRLTSLSNYWADQLHNHPSIQVLRPPVYGAMLGLRSAIYKAKELQHHLAKAGYHVKTVGDPYGKSPYLRVSVNLYLLPKQLDGFVATLLQLHS